MYDTYSLFISSKIWLHKFRKSCQNFWVLNACVKMARMHKKTKETDQQNNASGEGKLCQNVMMMQ